MKKTLVATAMLLAIGHAAMAQTGRRHKDNGSPYPKFYVKASGGYFLSVSPGEFPNVGAYPPHETYTSLSTTTGQRTTLSDKVLTGSYGKGVSAGATFGVNFNRYIGAEITFKYYHSATNLMTKQVTLDSASGQPLGDIESNGHVNAFDIAPSIVIGPGHYNGLNPYVRFGVVVPVWGRLKIGTNAHIAGSTVASGTAFLTQTVVQRAEEVKPNVTVGFQGALGVTYPISHRFDVFAEAEYRNIPVRSKSKEVTGYSETTALVDPASGQTVQTVTKGLGDLSTAERQTIYQATLTTSSNTPTQDPSSTLHPAYKNNNVPSNDLKSYINIGGLGFNAGLRLRL